MIDNPQGALQAGGAKQFTQSQLEVKARSLIAVLAPKVNLKLFTPQPGNKGNIFFFRWVEKKSPDFIQCSYSSAGQLLNYINGLN